MFAWFTAESLCTLNGYFGKSSDLNYYWLVVGAWLCIFVVIEDQCDLQKVGMAIRAPCRNNKVFWVPFA